MVGTSSGRVRRMRGTPPKARTAASHAWWKSLRASVLYSSVISIRRPVLLILTYQRRRPRKASWLDRRCACRESDPNNAVAVDRDLTRTSFFGRTDGAGNVCARL